MDDDFLSSIIRHLTFSVYSTDGWIKVWDPISGENIKVLHNKIPRNAPVDRSNIDLFAVKSIVCTDYIGVAAIGNQIKSWDFSPDKQLLSRRKLRPKKSNNAGNLYTSRGQLQAEIHEEMRESKTRIAGEKKAIEEASRTLEKMTLGLSDQECLDYAIMLSEEASIQSSPRPQATAQAEPSTSELLASAGEDEELLQAVIASLETAKHEHQDELHDDLDNGTYTPSNDSISLFSESTSNADDKETYQQLDDSTEWPSIGNANGGIPGSWSNNSRVMESEQSHSSPAVEYVDDENDEELQYVLKLSRGEI